MKKSHTKNLRKSFGQFLNHPALKHSRFSRANLAIFILIFASIGGYILLQSHAASSTANLWVAPNGSDSGANCTRFATPITNPDSSGASLCKSLTQAYQLASPGDNVLMLGGTYTSRQGFTAAMKKADGQHCDYGSGDLSGCITFAPTTGANVTFNVAGTNTQAIGSCVTYLRIQNVTINKTTYIDQFGDTVSNASLSVGAGDNSCGPTPPHDNLFENISYGGQAGVVGGAYNTYIVGGVETGENDLPWQFYGQGNNGAIAGSHDNGLIGVFFQGYNYTNDDSLHHHMECVHVDVGSSTASGLIFRDNTFVGCPLYSISFQAFGSGTIDSAIIEGNIFGNTSNGSLYLDLHANGGAITNNIVRFNTFESPSAFDPFYQPGVIGTVSGNVYYGNLNPSCSPSSPGWTPSYNVYSISQTNSCIGDNTSSYNQAISFVSPGSPNYNWHLANCTQKAADFVPTGSVGGYPAFDISNITRPQGTRLDAGAFEDCPAAVPTGRANLWVDADGGSCTRQAAVAVYFDSQACGSFQAAYAAAQSGDNVRVKCGVYSVSSFVNIAYDPAKDSLPANIVFSSEDGSRCVTLPNTSWSIQGAHVEFHHMAMDMTGCTNTQQVPPCPSIAISSSSPNASTGAHDVVIDDITASRFYISAAWNILVLNSDFGPSWDQHGLLHCNGSSNPCVNVPHDITIKNVKIHDYYNTDACKADPGPTGCFSTHHQGCALTVNNGYNITFDRFQSYNCEDLPFYIHPFLGSIHDVTVQNSYIGANAQPTQVYDDQASGGFWNIKFINNIFAGAVSLLPSTSPAVCIGTGGSNGCEWRANIGGVSQCTGNGGFSDGWTVEYNVSTAVYCGSGSLLGGATGTPIACGGMAVCRNNYKTTSYGLSADGYHLLGNSALLDLVPASLSWIPPADIDGDTRPQGTAVDLGADEFTVGGGGTPKTGDINNDNSINVLDLSILLSHYNQAATSSQGDLNNNNFCDISDLSILLSNWGK